jgi:hypothetical protein|tara:strand:+ start:1410 stop:1721 length:312 start_codon:yes stop_codon:yes gene_type:complete
MPYTQEELQKLSFYQNLINEDEQQYLENRQALELRAGISGSANQGQPIRDESNSILLFEDPYRNQLLQDEASKIVYDLRVRTLKTKESDNIIEEVLDRGFREL